MHFPTLDTSCSERSRQVASWRVVSSFVRAAGAKGVSVGVAVVVGCSVFPSSPLAPGKSDLGGSDLRSVGRDI